MACAHFIPAILMISFSLRTCGWKGGTIDSWSYDGSHSLHSCYFYDIFFIAHAQMEGWYDRQLVCPRSLYVEVLVPTQKHKLCQTFTKTAILDEQIWVEI